jgi:hypothetical protein
MIVFSADQMPAKTEQILNGGMRGNESLSLFYRTEFSHPSFPHPGHLMRLLSPIILVLLGSVDGLWNQFPVGNTITAQLVSYDHPRFISMAS